MTVSLGFRFLSNFRIPFRDFRTKPYHEALKMTRCITCTCMFINSVVVSVITPLLQDFTFIDIWIYNLAPGHSKTFLRMERHLKCVNSKMAIWFSDEGDWGLHSPWERLLTTVNSRTFASKVYVHIYRWILQVKWQKTHYPTLKFNIILIQTFNNRCLLSCVN